MQAMPLQYMHPAVIDSGTLERVWTAPAGGSQPGTFEGMLLGMAGGCLMGDTLHQQESSPNGAGINKDALLLQGTLSGNVLEKLIETLSQTVPELLPGVSLSQVQECSASTEIKNMTLTEQYSQIDEQSASAFFAEEVSPELVLDVPPGQHTPAFGSAGEEMQSSKAMAQSGVEQLMHLLRLLTAAAATTEQKNTVLPTDIQPQTGMVTGMLQHIREALCQAVAGAGVHVPPVTDQAATVAAHTVSAEEGSEIHAAQQLQNIIGQLFGLTGLSPASTGAGDDFSVQQLAVAQAVAASLTNQAQRAQDSPKAAGTILLEGAPDLQRDVILGLQHGQPGGIITKNILPGDQLHMMDSLSRTIITKVLQAYSTAGDAEQPASVVIGRSAYPTMPVRDAAPLPVAQDIAAGQSAVAQAGGHLDTSAVRFDAHSPALKQADMPALNSQYLIDQLSQRISNGMRQNESTITLQLHPPSLGKLQIELNVIDNHLRAVIIASSNQVKYALEHSLDQLRSALQNQNIEVEKFTVQVEQDANQFASLLRDRAGSRHRKSSGFSAPSEELREKEQGVDETVHSMNSRRLLDSCGLNLFA